MCCLSLGLQPYMAVFPPLLNPMFWERPGNVPALTRLLVAYLAKAGQELAAAGARQQQGQGQDAP
jgi:exportin-2 (importin alpha re-exporter)